MYYTNIYYFYNPASNFSVNDNVALPLSHLNQADRRDTSAGRVVPLAVPYYPTVSATANRKQSVPVHVLIAH